MALPNQWWKQGDLRAGGKGLKGLQFTPEMFKTWGKPQYADATGMGDSDPRMVDPWHSIDNPLYRDSNAWSNYQFEQDPSTGEMSLVVKSGDKEGTRYKLDGSPDKGFTVGDPAESFNWNTNTPASYYAQAFAPLGAAFGAGLLSELGNIGTGAAGAAGGGSSGLLGASDALSNIGWGAEHAATGAGVGGMAGGAWSVPGMTTAAGLGGAALPAVTNIADVYASGAQPIYATPDYVPPQLKPTLDKIAAPPAGAPTSGAPGSGTPTPTPTPGSLENILKGTGTAMDWLKVLGPLAGGLFSYFDAKKNDGRVLGDPGLLQSKPQFSTGLMGPWGRY